MPDDQPHPTSVSSASPDAESKLVASKRRWALEGRLLTGETAAPTVRLPPGQREVKNWPVLDLGIQPEVPRDAWTLTVDGLVENPLAWDWAAFQAQPQLDTVSDIHCVTSWSRYDNQWRGVETMHLLALVEPKPDARFVLLHSHDGYTTNLPLERFAEPGTLLAHSWEGRPLTTVHGGPVRLVLPRLYFWKSAKWLKRIEFLAEDQPGFWEVRGYHNLGDPWLEQRYG